MSTTMNYVEQHAEKGHLIVRGNCRICKERIEKSALSVAGVNRANWNISNGVLDLSFNPDKTGLEEISRAIACAGHETNLHEIDQAIRDQLPVCCKPVKC